MRLQAPDAYRITLITLMEHVRGIFSYGTSSSSSPLALPIRKSYRVTLKLEDEEEAAPEGQQQAVSIVDTVTDEPLGLGNGALRHRELALGEGSVPNAFEVGQSSRSVLEYEGAERISAFRQPTLVTWVDPEDDRVYIDIPTYVPPAAPV
ncbi:hypothetical protein Tco_1351173 [Tanacetum coccineum]